MQDTLGRLMFQDMLFPEGHHLSGYHYSGGSLSCVPAGGDLPPSSISFSSSCEKRTDLDWAVLLAGSDCWTAEEKRYFNKGIVAYRKDFIMVQKLVGILDE